MRDINDVLFYPSYIRSIYVPIDGPAPYNIIFYPENSSFLAAYKYLDIRKQFGRRVTYHGSTVPRLISTRDRMRPYMSKYGLIPFTGYPPRDNIYTDETPFLRKIDQTYKPLPYRRVDVLQKTIDHIELAAKSAPLHKSVLMYYVDKTEPVIKNVLYRRVWPLFRLYERRGGEFPFHIVLMAIRFSYGIKYQMLWHAEKPKKFETVRLRQIFQSMFTFSGKPVDMTVGEFDE